MSKLDSDLIKATTTGECVLFVGAGLGKPAGYPTWHELLKRMLSNLESESKNWDDLRSLLDEGKHLIVAELLASRLDRKRLLQVAIECTSGNPNAPIPTSLAALREIPFAGVVTSTWDNFIERVFKSKIVSKFTPNSSSKLPGAVRSGEFFLLKPYGTIDDIDSLIFLPEEYREMVSRNSHFARFVGSLFSTNSIFFVGASLETIEGFLSNSEIRRRSERVHFALVPRDEETELQQERLLSKYNLRLITFDPSSGFQEVSRFVQRFRDKILDITDSKLNLKLNSTHDEILDSVTLLNIGPFTHLNFRLQPNWNLVIGDNGCGKSTILRAISLALCGDDGTEDAAHTLLRSDARFGYIELKIGNDSYRTELTRESNRVAVGTSSYTPVQAGTRLVMGFPALRGASQLLVKGPSSPRANPDPMVEDLLPLMNNSIDTRFDDLKQWLVNIAILSEQPGSNRKKYQLLRDSFFRVVQRLTPNFNFRYAGFSEDPWGIIIETPDGKILMDQVSQGMTAVFCWVGTIFKRLWDVYPKSKNPCLEGFLVLIDEIDAHLHPEWQTEIMSLLREVFPNLQILATTHSPLVAANANAGEVSYLRRLRSKIEFKRIEYSFKGWRADQILTAEGFGLNAARDKETREKLARYRELVAKPYPNEEDIKEIDEISNELDKVLPSHHDLEATRMAADLMTEWMRGQIKDTPEEKMEEVLREARIYFANLKQGN